MFHILTTIATLLGYTSWLVTPAVRQQTETYGGDHWEPWAAEQGCQDQH